MGVPRSQKVTANGIFVYSREEPGKKKLGSAFRAEANHAKSRAVITRHTAEREACDQKVSVWQVESQSVSGKLPFLRGLALSNTNRAGRIAFANCFLDW
jgi:hypothetical protein